jgi:cobalt-zinc-cadmium efflux system protein
MATEHNHTHGTGRGAPARALAIAFVLTTSVMVLQYVGGWLANSLALVSDAGHMMTDALALAIALLAIRLAKRPSNAHFTFGFHRFEIFAAIINALMLFAIAVYIAVEAWGRFKNPPASNIPLTLAIASIGLIVNFFSMRLLMKSGSDNNLNLKGAYLEVWSDMIGSLGVIASAVITYFTGWKWLDPLVALLIAVYVLPRAWSLLKEGANVLLEAAPRSLDALKITAAIGAVAGVTEIHEVHVWSLTSGKNCVSAHAVVKDITQHTRVLTEVTAILRTQFDIAHPTVQLEALACEDGQCAFERQADADLDTAKSADHNDHKGHDHV